MFRLDIDTKRRKAAVIRRTQTLDRNVFRGQKKIVADLFGCFNPRILRIDNADKTYLLNAVRVFAAVFAKQFIDAFLVWLAGKLNQEITGIHFEHARQQFGIIDVGAVRRVAIAARTRVNTDVLSLVRRKTV